jgi:hypothetical protein
MPHPDVLPSAELIDRTLRIENSYTISRVQVLESLPGNPVGIAVRHIGGTAVAFSAKHFPNPNFNKVAGLRGEQGSEIEPLVAWCRDNGVKPRFEILPRAGDSELCRELTRLGFFPSDFHTSLVRDISPMPQTARSGDVELVTTAEVLEEFLDAYCAGWLSRIVRASSATCGRGGSAGKAGRCFWRGRMAARRRQPSFMCTTRPPISPTPPAIRPTGGVACSLRCCNGASARRLPQASTSSAAARRSSPAAIATWSAPACVCSSSVRSGRSATGQRIRACRARH